MIAEHIAALLIGFILDLIIGDPVGRWHPVCGIGWLIGTFENMFRKHIASYDTSDKSRRELLSGIVLVVLVCTVTGLVTAGVLAAAGLLHPRLRFLVQVIMCWQLLALKSLKTESMKVHKSLYDGDTEGARFAVSMIVGRDTKELNDIQIAKAAIETIAENTSDGVIAPFLYLLIGGPVSGFLYKAVNTMDSMVGYRNDKYEYFGRAAAYLDDILNFLPSRISAVLMILAAWLLRYDAMHAIRIFRRDRMKHKSPNSAQTESVCAGALGISLAGDASYFGIPVKKPEIGDALKRVEYEDIRRANRLLYAAALLLAGITMGGYVWFLMSMGGIFTAVK